MSVTDLWLPILVAAAFVFVVSSVVHMALPIHKGDWKQVPNEPAVMDALRAQGVKPGDYAMPWASCMKDLGSPEVKARFDQGPVAFLTVRPNGMPNMGGALGQWFVFSVVVGVIVAYVASLGLPRGADSMMVFRVTGATAWLGYGASQVCDSIWKGVNWTTSWKFVFDALLYGLATGAAFAWLWPDAPPA